jgi:hypothetical protein
MSFILVVVVVPEFHCGVDSVVGSSRQFYVATPITGKTEVLRHNTKLTCILLRNLLVPARTCPTGNLSPFELSHRKSPLKSSSL